MEVYTYSEARQRLAELLEKAVQEGEVRIRRRNGQVFVVRPERAEGSPFDVKGLDLTDGGGDWGGDPGGEKEGLARCHALTG